MGPNYKRIAIRVKGKKKLVPLHRVLYLSWGFTIPKGWVVHHKDGNRFNNSRNNLIAVSPMEHARIHSKSFRKVDGEWFKRCASCRKWVPITGYRFTPRKDRKGVLRNISKCRICYRKYIRRYMTTYRLTHRALVNAIALKSYYKNRARRRNAG